MFLFRRLERCWRILATGVCFSVFGLGGIILTVLCTPFFRLLPGHAEVKKQRGKKLIHYSFRAFIELMNFLRVLSYEVPCRNQLNQPGQLILANHPTLIDVVFLIAFIERADCIVKASLLRNPFMKGPIGAAGYLANDDPEQLLSEAVTSLQAGNSLIIFPEGTRTEVGQTLKMKRGAANIALKANIPITPVIIKCEPPTLGKCLPWYAVPEKRCHFSLTIKPSIALDAKTVELKTTLAARVLTKKLVNYFSLEIGLYE